MRFLVDAQLPPALARCIVSQGFVAEHVAIVLTPTERDAAIVEYAVKNDAVIVTKDSDFLTLAPPPPLLLVNTGNMQNRALLALFEVQFSQRVTALAKGDLIVEIS